MDKGKASKFFGYIMIRQKFQTMIITGKIKGERKREKDRETDVTVVWKSSAEKVVDALSRRTC